MARAKGGDAYSLDDVSNVPGTPSQSDMPYPMGKGDTGLDGVESVDTDAGMTYKGDEAFPTGARVPLNAVTELPEGKGAETPKGEGANVETWPKAFE